jgi:hypothetical protein
MRRLFAAAMLIVCASSPAWASTNVCGNVVNQTWTPAGSPYLVTCDLVVSGLTIQPGVSVVFLGNYLFEMQGKLTAIGTPSDSIRFTCPDSVSGWQGLFFNSSLPGSELAYCVIERATSHGIEIDRSQPVIHDCAIRRNTNSTGGAGIFTNSSLTLQHCTISDNAVSSETNYGGGIYTTAAMTLQQCTICDNSVSGTYSFGAGIFTTSPLTLRHCTIRGNAADGWQAYGGGIYSSASLQLFDCRISRNSVSAFGSAAYSRGGGLCAETDTATVIMERCVVDSNMAGGNSYACGAGIYSAGALSACNTEIARNQTASAVNYASGIYADRSAVLLNCTIAYNSHWGVGSTADSVTIWNSIVFFNNGGGDQIETALTNVRYSDVQGGYPGDGNIPYSPLFASTSNLHIVEGSPCIDAGDPLPRYVNIAGDILPRGNDVCFPPSLGTSRIDIGQDGGPGACTGDELGLATVDEPASSTAISLAVAPNPTRGESRISFVIPREGDVKIDVCDAQGRAVARLVDQRMAPGAHTVQWNGRGRAGLMNPGVYLVRLRTQDRTEVRRLALIR